MPEKGEGERERVMNDITSNYAFLYAYVFTCDVATAIEKDFYKIEILKYQWVVHVVYTLHILLLYVRN